MRAIVCFHALAPRHFTHCFVCFETNDHWVRLDAEYGWITVSVECEAGRDLAAWWRANGMTVIEVEVKRRRLRIPVIPATCVALVKRGLGLRAPLVFTAQQLHNYLIRGSAQCR